MSGGRFLTPKEQVKHCEAKGIQFNRLSKSKATIYLENNNNYFKLRSFRKNYIKDSNLGKYTNLDFADLVDISLIDNQLRRILLEIALNIEHFSKVHLLKLLQETSEDGYAVVQDYISQLSPDNYNHLIADLNKNSGSTYCGNLHDKYIKNNITSCPVWVFIEVISFGQYLYFYEFCSKRCQNPLFAKDLKSRLYLMRTVKDLRNACAHNNCIINDLRAALPKKFRPNLDVNNALVNLGISRLIRNKHLKRAPFYQIITTLYAHTVLVSSDEEHNHISAELHKLKSDIQNKQSLLTNDIINASFNLLIKLIDNWFI